MAEILAVLGEPPDANLGVVVDWGCGAGRLTRVMAEQADWVFAADACPDLLAELDDLPNVGRVLTDIPLLAGPVGRVDLVVSLHVMPCVTPEGVRESIRMLAALLRPGGRLVLGIPYWYRGETFHKPCKPEDLPGGWRIHTMTSIVSGWQEDRIWLEHAPAPIRLNPGHAPRFSDLAPLSLWVWRKEW